MADKEDDRAQLNRSFRPPLRRLLRNGTAMALRRSLPIAQAGNNKKEALQWSNRTLTKTHYVRFK